jgi:hypothetical protein
MTGDLNIETLVVLAVGGSISLNLYFLKKELSGLRNDVKDSHDKLMKIAFRVARRDIICQGRHGADLPDGTAEEVVI